MPGVILTKPLIITFQQGLALVLRTALVLLLYSKAYLDLSRLYDFMYIVSLFECKTQRYKKPFGLALVCKVNYECNYYSHKDVLLAWKKIAVIEGGSEWKDGLLATRITKDKAVFVLSCPCLCHWNTMVWNTVKKYRVQEYILAYSGKNGFTLLINTTNYKSEL